MGKTDQKFSKGTTEAISIHDQGALELVQTLLQQGVSLRIQVSGRSMLPFLKGGEIVKLCPANGSTPQLGDLLFQIDPQNKPIVHRLVRRRYIRKVLHLQTKGDNCNYLDKFVPVDQIIARVQAVEVTDSKTNKTVITDLDTVAMHYKGLLVVIRGLTIYYLRRILAKPRYWYNKMMV